MEKTRIVISEFGTLAHPDPCLSIFGRFMSWFQSAELSDNCSVNLLPIADKCYAITEFTSMRKIDPVSLETLEKNDPFKKMAVHTVTAHPHIADDGTLFNMGSHFSRRCHYNIIKSPPPKPGEKEEPLSRASVLCSIPARERYPSYYHSFGMTDNYIVFVEQSLVLNTLRLFFSTVFGTGTVADPLEFHENQPVRFHLAKRDTGELLSQTFLADPFSFFHQINAYEDEGHVVVDLCCHEDNGLIKRLFFQELKTRYSTAGAEAKRFVLPVEREKKCGVDLNGLGYSKATAVLKEDGSIHCTPEVSADKELPRINYQYNGKPYKYFYGMSLNFQKIIKTNTRTVTSQMWREEGMIVSEPCFVAAPGATTEDDGVLLASIVSVTEDKPSFLLVLDAHDMKELARAEINVEINIGFHGIFLAN